MRCNFNPNVVEIDEWAQFAIFFNVLWFRWRTFLHAGSGVGSMQKVPLLRPCLSNKMKRLCWSFYLFHRGGIIWHFWEK
jgi:hypothetical protein